MTETPASAADPSDAGSRFVESPAGPESSEKIREEECDFFFFFSEPPEAAHGFSQKCVLHLVRPGECLSGSKLGEHV